MKVTERGWNPVVSEFDHLAVRATPEVMAELMARRFGDTGALTNYAIAHGVELPEHYTPGWEIAPVFDMSGNELGLYWTDPHEYAYET